MSPYFGSFGPNPETMYSLPMDLGVMSPQGNAGLENFTFGQDWGNTNFNSPIVRDSFAPNLITNLGGGMGNAPVPGSGWGNLFRGMVGTSEQPGWGGLGLRAASGIASTFMGMKQYGLAKNRLAAQKEQFERNYAAQRTTTNAQLEDRQRARVSADANAYESVGSYMDRNRIR